MLSKSFFFAENNGLASHLCHSHIIRSTIDEEPLPHTVPYTHTYSTYNTYINGNNSGDHEQLPSTI